MLILEVKGKKRSSIFAKLKDVFPECFYLIEDAPRLFPLFCLTNHCPRNANCMEKLAHRVKYLFDKFTDADLLLLYFSYRDNPGSQRAGVFWRDMREPMYQTLNRTAWEKMKEKGTIWEMELPSYLFLNPNTRYQSTE